MDFRLSAQEARSHLATYHYWLLNSKPSDASAAALKYDAVVKALEGCSIQGSYTHAMSARCQIRETLAAKERRMPMWGQKGSFIIQHQGITALVKSIQPPSQTCVFQLSLHAIKLDAPFISSTGYLSIIVSGLGWNMRDAVCSEIDALLTKDLCMIDSEYLDEIEFPIWAVETLSTIEQQYY